MVEIIDNIIPKPNASRDSILPSGTALFFVLSISESISLSYHILMAPEAPAPTDMQSIEIKKKKGCIDVGARMIPHIEVNTASDITRGFRSDIKSPTELLFSKFSRPRCLANFDSKRYLCSINKLYYFTFGRSSNE